jgi:outer membrane lipoprotein carrier protein
MRFRLVNALSPGLRCAEAALLAAGLVSVVGGTHASIDAEKGDAKRLVALFESRHRSARTLQATFLERYTENGRLVRTEAGTAFFRRPGKMRWEYASPEKNLFLVDGKTAWFYVPSDQTVMRVPAKHSTDWRTPLALLAGEMQVSRVCARVNLAPANEKAESEGNVVLRCELRESGERSPNGMPSLGEASAQAGQKSPAAPAASAKGDEVLFEVASFNGELARLLIRQGGGVQMEFRFANWRLDPPLPDSMFRFEVPAGVAIVNGELPVGEVGVK